MEHWHESTASDWRVGEAELVRTRYQWLLRPMSPFEMIDDAVAFYRENFPVMAKASVLVYAPLLTLVLVTLVPIVVLNATTRTPQPFATADIIYFASVCLAYPFLFITPALHAAVTSLVAAMRLQGEPVTIRSVWARLKPRFWHLIANQLLAVIALAILHVVIGIFFVILFIGLFMAVGVSATGGGGTTSLILAMLGSLFITILWVIAAAAVSVWFFILPQIVILEPNTDALTAFDRAFRLVGRNFRHAFLSALALIGFHAVALTASYLLVGMLAGLGYLIVRTYFDPEAFFLRWNSSLNQAFNLLYYLGFSLLMSVMYMTSFLLYYDLRYRYEGMDIRLALAQEGSLQA